MGGRDREVGVPTSISPPRKCVRFQHKLESFLTDCLCLRVVQYIEQHGQSVSKSFSFFLCSLMVLHVGILKTKEFFKFWFLWNKTRDRGFVFPCKGKGSNGESKYLDDRFSSRLSYIF